VADQDEIRFFYVIGRDGTVRIPGDVGIDQNPHPARSFDFKGGDAQEAHLEHRILRAGPNRRRPYRSSHGEGGL